MRWREIAESASAGATGSGSVAVVNQPLGMQTRAGGSMLSGKYSTDATPNTPPEFKRYKSQSSKKTKFQNEL